MPKNLVSVPFSGRFHNPEGSFKGEMIYWESVDTSKVVVIPMEDAWSLYKRLALWILDIWPEETELTFLKFAINNPDLAPILYSLSNGGVRKTTFSWLWMPLPNLFLMNDLMINLPELREMLEQTEVTKKDAEELLLQEKNLFNERVRMIISRFSGSTLRWSAAEMEFENPLS